MAFHQSRKSEWRPRSVAPDGSEKSDVGGQIYKGQNWSVGIRIFALQALDRLQLPAPKTTRESKLYAPSPLGRDIVGFGEPTSSEEVAVRQARGLREK